MIEIFDLKKLSSWRNDTMHHFNWFKEYIFKSEISFIGFNCITNDYLKNKIYKSIPLLKHELIWEAYGSENLYNYVSLYNVKFNYPKYTYLELDIAKNNMDKFLLSCKNLNAFI